MCSIQPEINYLSGVKHDHNSYYDLVKTKTQRFLIQTEDDGLLWTYKDFWLTQK
jgi:hypothetical protein